MKSVFALFVFFIAARLAALPAFPGAEGAGANALGGRGGTVFHVTNTNDNGSSSLAGSLRQGVSVANRTVVFDVAGTINLAADLKITVSNLTIAAQSAPGDGICIKGWSFMVENTHDVVVRHLRCRPGDVNCSSFQGDSFDFVNATNVIADHISATWSVDECFSPTWSTNVTLQWCLIGESMNNSCHVKGKHGYGTLMRYGNGLVSLHHNLYAHNESRNPRPGDSIKLDFVNNVVYDWGGFAGYNSDDTADNLSNGGLYFTNVENYVSNCFVAGPNTGSSHQSLAFDSGTTNALQCQIFQAGNYMDCNKNSSLDGSDIGWSAFSAPFTQLGSRYAALPPMTTENPLAAYERVLAFAGASLARDAVDARIVRTTRNHTGSIIDFISTSTFAGDYITNTVLTTNFVGVNPWPALASSPAPLDTDQDGMPDYWEKNLGLNPAVANNNHVNASGYTDLEDYLNFLGALHNFGGVNATNVTDLRVLTGNDTNHIFTVAGASNGIVALAGDGITAQFLPATNFIGLASFTFSATNAVNHTAFGPVPVALFITNLPPVIVAQPVNVTNAAGTNAQFSVGAANANLFFQWRRGGTNLVNGTKFSGATNATLTVTNISAADATNYLVVVTNFSGAVTSAPAALVIAAPPVNTPPTLTAISNRVVIAGVTVTFTNTASDTDAPPQTLTFSGLSLPSGATVNPSNGIFYWRPLIAQGGVTNTMKIVVTDSGSPNLNATQTFSVGVLNPSVPVLTPVMFAPLQFGFSVTGSLGPDYLIRASTNLVSWTPLLTTNPPALPFVWKGATTNFPQRFYQILLGP